MSKEKFTMRVSANLHLVHDGKILLLRRFNTGWKDGEYGVVAGHVDGNESIALAMVREAKEEAGIDIAEEDLAIVHAQHRINPHAEYIDFHLVPKKWSGTIENLEPDKCDDISWHSLDLLPKNTIHYMRAAILDIQRGVAFSEWREPNT